MFNRALDAEFGTSLPVVIEHAIEHGDVHIARKINAFLNEGSVH